MKPTVQYQNWNIKEQSRIIVEKSFLKVIPQKGLKKILNIITMCLEKPVVTNYQLFMKVKKLLIIN